MSLRSPCPGQANGSTEPVRSGEARGAGLLRQVSGGPFGLHGLEQRIGLIGCRRQVRSQPSWVALPHAGLGLTWVSLTSHRKKSPACRCNRFEAEGPVLVAIPLCAAHVSSWLFKSAIQSGMVQKKTRNPQLQLSCGPRYSVKTSTCN